MGKADLEQLQARIEAGEKQERKCGRTMPILYFYCSIGIRFCQYLTLKNTAKPNWKIKGISRSSDQLILECFIFCLRFRCFGVLFLARTVRTTVPSSNKAFWINNPFI